MLKLYKSIQKPLPKAKYDIMQNYFSLKKIIKKSYAIIIYFFLNGFCMANNKPITIIIHGTWFPVISSYIHKMYCPNGANKATDLPKNTIWSRVPSILSKANEELFPAESIYVFGWPGVLSSTVRENYAKILYEFILTQTQPINIIAHSHGGNIALNLAKIDTANKISIDRLILIACPVQVTTEKYIDSDIFKKTYHFYSTKDMTQILDPQGLSSKHFLKWDAPLLSRRTFSSKKILQTPIRINDKCPDHNEFISETFLSRLPKVLKEAELKQSNNYINIKT